MREMTRYLKSEAKGVMKSPFGESATKRSLTTFKAKLMSPPSFLTLMTSTCSFALARPNPTTLSSLWFSCTFIIPQIIQTQQTICPCA